jgi:hypothetical protein
MLRSQSSKCDKGNRTEALRDPWIPSSNTVSVAASLEAPSQYAGGSYSSQLNTGINALNSPSPLPDFIGKLALDHPIGGRALHLEVSGMLRRFAVYNPHRLVTGDPNQCLIPSVAVTAAGVNSG